MVKKSVTRKPKGFHMESLEARELMAGDVSVSVSGGNMLIQEAQYQSANSVWVQQLSNGQIRVQGLGNAAGGTTLVNGRAYQDFTVTGDLNVNLGAGDDSIYVYGGSFKNVNLQLNQVGAAADRDNVFVRDTKTTGSMTVKTGAGNDYVDVYHAAIGNDAYDSLNVFAGAGADTIRVNGWTSVRGDMSLMAYDNYYENDNDLVDVSTAVVYGGAYIHTGFGADTVNLTALTAGRNISLVTGDGADTVKLREVQAHENFYVALGNGDDTLETTYCRANSMQLDGGAGTDYLTRSQDGPVGSLSITGFEPRAFIFANYTPMKYATLAF